MDGSVVSSMSIPPNVDNNQILYEYLCSYVVT